MYFALNEFFLQRTQQYTHIKKILSTPLISTIGYEKDITLCKPFHAILNERSKEDGDGFGSHLCLLTCVRWGDWTLKNQTANQTKVSFVRLFSTSVRVCDVVCPLDTATVTELWRRDLFSCTSSSFLCAGTLSRRGKCCYFLREV